MSEACRHCGIQIHSSLWYPVNYRLMGVWPGSVQTTSAACVQCGNTTYYAQVNRGKRIGWTEFMLDLSTTTYRRPEVPKYLLDVWYVTHPLSLDSEFHKLAMKKLDSLRKDRVLLVTERRFEIDTTPFAGICVMDLEGGREGPYPHVLAEWSVSTTIHNRLGKSTINTIWPSYFRPGFEYHAVMSDPELYREFSYDFRRNLPVEIKVKS